MLRPTARSTLFPYTTLFRSPVVLVSFALMVPPIFYADRRNRPKLVLLGGVALRSEEHTSELQAQSKLVCPLLLEKKKLKVDCETATDREVRPTLKRPRATGR